MKLNNSYNKALNSKYELITQIGKGGMSKVFLAKRKQDNQKVAIKIINYTGDEKVILSRFEDEIKFIQSIKSRFVVKILDYCLDYENDEYWLVMEYIDGLILKDYIESNGFLNVSDVVNYGIQIAQGVQEIHNQKIIHRDLKDSNIMITNFNEIKIIDFGIALDEYTTRKTTEGKIVASVQYLAPEAAVSNFKPNIKLDIYALGVLLYQMLVGDFPFKGNDFLSIIEKHKREQLPKIKNIRPNIPQSLINVVIKATAKNSENRHKNMKELIYDLKTALNKERILEPEINFNKKQKKTFFEVMSSKNALIIISIFLVLIAIATIIVIILIII